MQIPLLTRGRLRGAPSADRLIRFPFRVRCTPAPALANPLPGEGRMALISSRFRSRGPVRCFPPAAAAALRDYSPQILAGSIADLLSMAGKIPAPRAIVAITDIETGLLTAEERDSLWHAFGVPIFEQHLDRTGKLIAQECEAHEGLHLMSRDARPAGIVREGECGCGRIEPRMFGQALARAQV